MILNLQNGQTITIYEDGDILTQLKQYLDPEIFELLSSKYSFIDSSNTTELKITKDFKNLIGKKITDIELIDDYFYIKTDDNYLLIVELYFDSEDSNFEFYDQEKFYVQAEYDISFFEYFIKTLANRNVISKEVYESIKNRRLEYEKKRNDFEKNNRFELYKRLKKEFEKEE